MSFINVYVTHPNFNHAKRIGEVLLKEHLIACVNYHSTESSYWWQGKIERRNEVVSILKTRKENWAKILRRIRQLHSDKLPCIMKIEVSASPDYEAWVKAESRPRIHNS